MSDSTKERLRDFENKTSVGSVRQTFLSDSTKERLRDFENKTSVGSVIVVVCAQAGSDRKDCLYWIRLKGRSVTSGGSEVLLFE